MPNACQMLGNIGGNRKEQAIFHRCSVFFPVVLARRPKAIRQIEKGEYHGLQAIFLAVCRRWGPNLAILCSHSLARNVLTKSRTVAYSGKRCFIQVTELSSLLIAQDKASNVGRSAIPKTSTIYLWPVKITHVNAGDDLLSQVVNAAIGFKPLYSVMKVAAKRVIQRTAEDCGVPWQQRVKDLKNTPEVLISARHMPFVFRCAYM